MRSIIPPGGLVTVSMGTFRAHSGDGWPATLVMIEVIGGPTFTLTPEQWREMVSKIRAAPTAADLGA